MEQNNRTWGIYFITQLTTSVNKKKKQKRVLSVSFW